MEFWGVEVKSGEPLKVSPGDDMVLHLSQACLGELKKANESVYLYVNVDGAKLVLGTLIPEKLPQQQFDLVFDKDFELSHNLKSGSVYFYGYLASNPYEDELPEDDSDDSDEEGIPLTVANGPPATKPKQEKAVEAANPSAAKGKESAAGKQKVKIVEPKKDDSSDELMSEDDEDDSDEDEDDSDDSEDESAESDEETPKKAEPSKKRPAESATKTPAQDKKAKVTVTPQKTDGKKVSSHVATPHPAKQAGKTPATAKPVQKSPKSGPHSCKSCDRTFGSDKALESHSKAKHAVAAK